MHAVACKSLVQKIFSLNTYFSVAMRIVNLFYVILNMFCKLSLSLKIKTFAN